MTDPRTWLVTGASSGFGEAIARVALSRGDTVVGVARSAGHLSALAGTDSPGRFVPLVLDVLDAARFDVAERTVRDVVAEVGRLDVLVNDAGRTEIGALEETTEDELRSLFELHVFAPAALTRAVLPVFRAQGGGTVVQMSSMAAQVTMAGFSVYCSTKAALELLTETLVDEVPGVRFVIVEPGVFRTGVFRTGAPVVSHELPAYRDTVGPSRQWLAGAGGRAPGDPARAAEAIWQVVTGDRAPLRLVLGPDAVEGIGARLDRRRAELAEWEALSRSTDLPDAATPAG
jgi:NAD(P)-dependent dehydrogenase (short-subunit alcohol dehydrogenase family)